MTTEQRFGKTIRKNDSEKRSANDRQSRSAVFKKIQEAAAQLLFDKLSGSAK
jgi:hypothetical protein